MTNPEKFEMQENENCPICGGTGPCGDSECKHGQAYEAEQLKKMEEAYEQKNSIEETRVEKTTKTPPVPSADDDYDARGDLGYPRSSSLRRNR